MGLSDEDRAEVASLVAEQLAAGAEPGAPAPPAEGPWQGEAPLGRVGRVLGFSPHGLLSALVLGAFFCCSAFDVAAHVAPEPYTYPRSSYWLLVLGLLTGAVALATGIVDQWRLDPDSPAAAAGRRHQVVAYAALGLALVSFLLRRRTDFIDEVPVAIVLLSVASLLLLVVSWGQGARLARRPGRAPST
jgi:uncharacterized membrane protein